MIPETISLRHTKQTGMRPIGRIDNNKSYTIQNYYESYIKHIDGNPLYYVNRKKFRDIVEDYFRYLADRIILDAAEIKLPARMGNLSVIKKKPSRFTPLYLRTDFKASVEAKKRIVHMNDHSDGYSLKFLWSKKDMIVKNKEEYQLIMSRANKRRLASIIKNKEQDYIEK